MDIDRRPQFSAMQWSVCSSDLMTWQLSFPCKWSQGEQCRSAVIHDLTLEVTPHNFCNILLVTQVNPSPYQRLARGKNHWGTSFRLDVTPSTFWWGRIRLKINIRHIPSRDWRGEVMKKASLGVFVAEIWAFEDWWHACLTQSFQLNRLTLSSLPFTSLSHFLATAKKGWFWKIKISTIAWKRTLISLQVNLIYGKLTAQSILHFS